MAVQLTGLSGSNRGKTFRFSSLPISIGDDNECSVVFSRRQDAQARGKRLEIIQNESGWQLHNTGKGTLFLNQEVVPFRGTSPIRSGDILRLSEMGPDFRFTIIVDSATQPQSDSVGDAGEDRTEGELAEATADRPRSRAGSGSSQDAQQRSDAEYDNSLEMLPSVRNRKAIQQALVAALVGILLASVLILLLTLRN